MPADASRTCGGAGTVASHAGLRGRRLLEGTALRARGDRASTKARRSYQRIVLLAS